MSVKIAGLMTMKIDRVRHVLKFEPLIYCKIKAGA